MWAGESLLNVAPTSLAGPLLQAQRGHGRLLTGEARADRKALCLVGRCCCSVLTRSGGEVSGGGWPGPKPRHFSCFSDPPASTACAAPARLAGLPGRGPGSQARGVCSEVCFPLAPSPAASCHSVPGGSFKPLPPKRRVA